MKVSRKTIIAGVLILIIIAILICMVIILSKPFDESISGEVTKQENQNNDLFQKEQEQKNQEEKDSYIEPIDIEINKPVKENSVSEPKIIKVVKNKKKYVSLEMTKKVIDEKEVRVIVKFKDDFQESNLGNKVKKINRKTDNTVSVNLNKEQLLNFDKWAENNNVEEVKLDRKYSTSLVEVIPITKADLVWSQGYTGKGQSVCVVDSGINYNHDDLVDAYIGGYDFVNDDADPMDDNGHGTFVSGVVAGIAPDAKIVGVKVFDEKGDAFESDILAGIHYCIENKENYNISVIVLAFGGGEYEPGCVCDSNLVAEKSNFAVSQGIFVVAASGNTGDDFLKAPACGTNLTSVGAVDKYDNIASFTNIEPLLDILAPGVDVVSSKSSGGTETKSGTSVAAAVVAGIAPLILEREILPPLDLEFRLRATGNVISHDGTDYPRVDAEAAFTNTVTNNPFQPQGTQCEGEWSEYGLLGDCCDDKCDGILEGMCNGPQCEYPSGNGCGSTCADNGDCTDECSGSIRAYDWDDYSCDTDCASCSCYLYQQLDPDASSTYCNDCSSTCWACGGEVSGSACCADDAGEYVITEASSTDAPSGYNGGQTTCCDGSGNCAYSRGAETDVCKNTGQASNQAIPGMAYCSSNVWYGGDYSSSACSAIAGSGRYGIGGETASSDCCGDDNSEYRISESSSTDAPSGYNDGITTCCDTSTDCTYNDACTATGSASAPAVPSKAYCGASNTWYGGDYSSAACTAIAGASRWQIGGSTGDCCEDDSGEVYRYCQAGTGFSDAGTCTSADSQCCDASTDCVNVAGNLCVNSGTHDTQGDGDSDDDYCLSGIWYDCYNDGDCDGGATCSSNDCVGGGETIDGGSGTTCDSSNPCFFVKNSSSDIIARFDSTGNVDIKGELYESQGALSCSNCFQIQDSGGTLRLYINSSGNLYTQGTYAVDASPTPSGNNDFQIKDSVGTVVGYIDGASGNMSFKGVLHYNSDY